MKQFFILLFLLLPLNVLADNTPLSLNKPSLLQLETVKKLRISDKIQYQYIKSPHAMIVKWALKKGVAVHSHF